MLSQFFKDISVEGCLIQIGSENRVFDTIPYKDSLQIAIVQKCIDYWNDHNLFFLGGVKEDPTMKTERASDADILKKNYFYIDLDLRKAHPEMTDADIKDSAKTWKELLELDRELRDWRYIVFTGNGLHIYYMFEPVEVADKNAWKMGLTEYIKRAETLLSENIDHACVNVARIARLPSSFNHKSEPPKHVEIIDFQDKYAAFGATIQRTGAERMEKIKEDNERKASELKVMFPLELDTYKAIQSLPIANVVCRIFGWDTDGKHFYSAGSKQKSACFVPEGENYLVHGGTSHIPPTQTGFRAFELVKEVKKWENRDVFQWFKEQYVEISRLSIKEQKEKEQHIVEVAKAVGGIGDVFSELATNTFEQLEIGGGFDPYKFLIRGAITRIGAYSNIGKSKLTYFLTHLLLKKGYRGILFSTEVPRHIVLANMLNIETGQHFWDIMYRRYVPPQEVQDLYKLLEIYDVTHTQNNLVTYEALIKSAIDDAPLKGIRPPDFVIIDFCQAVTPSKRSEGEYDQMSRYALEVQSLAQRLNIAVIDVSQISNAGLSDEHASSGMIPYKGSGHLYSSADVGILLKRNKKESPENMEVHIRKHKYMPPAIFTLICDWKNGKFSIFGDSFPSHS